MRGRLLHNVLHYSTWVLYERYITGCCSPVSSLFFIWGVLMRLSRTWKCKAEQVWVWRGSKKQTKGKGGNRSDGVLFFLLSEFKEEKKILRWARDKARLLSCYGNSYTPISLFAEYCAVIFDEPEHTCVHLQITHIHTQRHAVRTIKLTVQITALEKIAIILDETSVSVRAYR